MARNGAVDTPVGGGSVGIPQMVVVRGQSAACFADFLPPSPPSHPPFLFPHSQATRRLYVLPPTSTESRFYVCWFRIVIDAGSSDSRLQMHNWKEAAVLRQLEGEESYHRLPKVEKGT